MNSEKFYLRAWCNGYDPRRPEMKRGFYELIGGAVEIIKMTRYQPKIDAVSLDDGTVVRHDYKVPIPPWLKEPLIREIAMNTGQFPQHNRVLITEK